MKDNILKTKYPVDSAIEAMEVTLERCLKRIVKFGSFGEGKEIYLEQAIDLIDTYSLLINVWDVMLNKYDKGIDVNPLSGHVYIDILIPPDVRRGLKAVVQDIENYLEIL